MKPLSKYTKEELFEELNKIEEEEKRLSNLSIEQRVAEYLHSFLCSASHIDQCGWEYEDWGGAYGPTRKRYLEKARKVLEVADEDTIVKLLSILH